MKKEYCFAQLTVSPLKSRLWQVLADSPLGIWCIPEWQFEAIVPLRIFGYIARASPLDGNHSPCLGSDASIGRLDRVVPIGRGFWNNDVELIKSGSHNTRKLDFGRDIGNRKDGRWRHVSRL